tara:strand:+ start:1825 stop:3585 length:1761 start_codon:yes stop_codon:yes gene_type:complete
MCGVLLAYAKKGQLNQKNCKKASEKIFSRGPDFNFSRFKFDNRLFLSQTVLSITGKPELNLDYTRSKNGRYEILFNGEIYNFKELQSKYLDKKHLYNLSCSDTETIINLHQLYDPIEVKKMIKGMYAYVVYDSKENKLFISRDIIGEKVLYEYEDEKLFIVSSQLGPILEIVENIKINKKILKKYFFTRHLLTQKETVYKNIKVFQPGETVGVNLVNYKKKILGNEQLADLIDPVKINDNSNKTSNEILREVDNLFQENAKFLNPDIPFFSVVSGGIDSSLVSKYLKGQSDIEPNYICLQFPGKDNVASGVKHFEKFLEKNIKQVKVDINLFQDFLEESYKSICMPLPTHSFISQAILAREVNKNGMKILFTGDGGDELFGGYEFYKTINYDKDFNYNPSIYSGVFDQGVKFNDFDMKEILEESNITWLKIKKSFEGFDFIESNIQSILLLDTQIQLESVGIRASDTMSMMSSVESRGFFLTMKIIEFALNLPAKNKISFNGTTDTRPLMKDLFIKNFDKSLLKPKQGFSGFPNESMKRNIDNFDITKDYLDIVEFENLEIKNDLSLEWKLLNVEYFLKTFSNYAK